MLHLASETDRGWVGRVSADLPTLLLDHAHCEKKAASTSINLIFRYQIFPELMTPLSALAREELEHFELVIGVMGARGLAFGPLAPSPYAEGLYRAVRREEPHRLLDTLLVCSLIEARSCERMKLLAEGLADPELAELYRGLLASEARHHTTYTRLGADRFGADVVEERLRELADHEARVVADMPCEVRMHSAG